MAVYSENVRHVRAILAKRRNNAISESERRAAETAERIPSLREIRMTLSETGARIMGEAMNHTLTEERLCEIRAENERLRQLQAALLTANGYPADYLDIHYTCEKCADTGYVGIDMCECMRRELVTAGMESAGLVFLAKNQSFETFSLYFYKNNDKIWMEQNVARLRKFAYTFDGKSGESFLLTGATGLGKTHLSTSVAKVVIERGYDVIYDTTQDILAVFEEERFSAGNGVQHEKGRTVERILTCDLLIIDDLGTEITNQFTLSCLYNILNTRINHAKSTILNTNLTQNELRTRYTDRIASRLFGECKPLLFQGKDIRLQKLQ